MSLTGRPLIGRPLLALSFLSIPMQGAVAELATNYATAQPLQARSLNSIVKPITCKGGVFFVVYYLA